MGMKNDIERDLIEQRLEDANQKIKIYEKEFPYDLDNYSMKALYAFYNGNIDHAIEECKKGLEQNIYNYDLNYNIAVFYEYLEEFFLAYEYYVKAKTIKECSKDNDKDTVIKNLADDEKRVISKIEASTKLKTSNEIKQVIKRIKELEENEQSSFGLVNILDWINGSKKMGHIFKDSTGNKLFASKHQNYVDNLLPNDMLNRSIDVRKVWHNSKSFQFYSKDIIVLPISTLDSNIHLIITEEDKEYSFKIEPKTFYYFRLQGNIKIESSTELIIGEPIKLGRDKNKKALVLNIFVDGLSSIFLDEYGIEELMPRTYDYFREGVKCSNMYTASDWTYPSIASFNTGKYVVNHKLYHPSLCRELPIDYPILAEHFHNEGYTTAKVDGDWRSTPNYGYARGMDRTIYKRGCMGGQIITEVIEHIEFMKDTNQFLWICVDNLHEIADGIEQKASIQKVLSLEARVISDASEPTSVKQRYNTGKIERYKEQIKYIDRDLSLLYSYIKDNFKEDDIIVTLFSDHGQGYLLRDEEFFLADSRAKVPLFIKSSNLKTDAVCDELVSAVDYMPILCKLAEIPIDMTKIDGNLPISFGGTKEREYVYIESLHPGDPYYAVIKDKDRIFHFSTVKSTNNDGRIDIEAYEAKLYDTAGTLIEDRELLNNYINVVFEHIREYILY